MLGCLPGEAKSSPIKPDGSDDSNKRQADRVLQSKAIEQKTTVAKVVKLNNSPKNIVKQEKVKTNKVVDKPKKEEKAKTIEVVEKKKVEKKKTVAEQKTKDSKKQQGVEKTKIIDNKNLKTNKKLVNESIIKQKNIKDKTLKQTDKLADKPKKQIKANSSKDEEKQKSLQNKKPKIDENKSTNAQISMFADNIGTSIKVEKQDENAVKLSSFKRFVNRCGEVYDLYSKQTNHITFNKKDMLKAINEYAQSLIVAKELAKGNNANEYNMHIALEISWFGNLFENTANLVELSQKARTKLLEVPYVFMASVVLDVRNKTQITTELLALLKKSFLTIYPQKEAEFGILTKPIVNFVQKQGIQL